MGSGECFLQSGGGINWNPSHIFAGYTYNILNFPQRAARLSIGANRRLQFLRWKNVRNAFISARCFAASAKVENETTCSVAEGCAICDHTYDGTPQKKGTPPLPELSESPPCIGHSLRVANPHPSPIVHPSRFFFCNVKRYLPLVVATLPRRVLPTRIIPGRYPSRKRLGKNGRKFLISTACTRVPSTSLLHDKKN